MTSKLSRPALVAALAIGASGLVAVPAEAANGISTANYYVNSPAAAGATQITPESAILTGAVDTGGSPESQLPVPAAGLTWDGQFLVTAGIKWVNNTTGADVPVDGIPVTGSSSKVSVTVTDSTDAAINGIPTAVSNNGADDYSDVTFWADPASDYVANGNEPGDQTVYTTGLQVPTATGISSVSTTAGAFGLAAQNSTGNTPLTPGTKYVYGLIQQAGATDAATTINIAQWAAQTTNPTYKCYPNAAIALDPTLSSYTASTQITYDGTTAAALQGPCTYYYGNTGNNLYYQSTVGTFTTLKLGKLAISGVASVAGNIATVAIVNKSAFKASGSLQLTTKSGKSLGIGKFKLAPNGSGTIKLKLTGRGVAAAAAHSAGLVNLTSNWDQKTSTKRVTL